MAIETKTIRLEKETVRDHGVIYPMGPVQLDLPEGSALCHDALSCTLITALREQTGEKFIAIIAVADFDGRRLGTLAQFTPDEARSFAASLLHSAELIDGGSGKVN